MHRSLCSYKNNLWIGRMDDHFSNMSGFFQTHIFPGLTCIGRLIDPISITGHHSPNSVFTRSHINYIGVRFRYSYISNRTNFKKPIRNIFPRSTSVICHPNSTTGITRIKALVVFYYARNGIGTSTSKRSNIAPFKTGVHTVWTNSYNRSRSCFFFLLSGKGQGKTHES